jgi:hypothetical protein
VHIEGAKALLCFLPHASKGIKGPICGPIRDAFLQAAAILLIVPERYQHIVGQLELTIAPSRSRQHYNKSRFGDENHVNESSIAHFFATIGVTTDEAEKWQPWAAAYIDIELHEQTDNTIAESLRQARQRAREQINSDSKWVFKNLPPECPGHYKLASTTPHMSHVAQPEASSSTNADVEPSSSTNTATGTSSPNNADTGPSTITPMHPDATEQSDIHLGYGGDEDDDTRMGLA